MLVKDAMVPVKDFFTPRQTVAEACLLLSRLSVPALPVTGSGGEIAGLLGCADLLAAAAENRLGSAVEEVVTQRDIFFVTEETPLLDAWAMS
ncbi:MAG: CBS domain-containing protein, partial [Desulfotomaculales bacterium]